jgi:hypothetical protein
MLQRGNSNAKEYASYVRYGMLAVALCLVVLAVAFAPTVLEFIIKSAHANQRCGACGAPNFWEVQQGQTTVKRGNDIFAIKNVDVSAQGFRLFYVFSSSTQEQSPQIIATSVLSSQPKKDLPLPVKNQPLSELGKFSTGVVQIPYVDRAGQIITFHIMFSKSVFFDISPLNQLQPELGMSGGFFIDQKYLPEITWNGQSGEYVAVAFFQLNQPKANTSRLFLQLDNPVKVISETEYKHFAGTDEGSTMQSCNTQSCSEPLSPGAIRATLTAEAVKK